MFDRYLDPTPCSAIASSISDILFSSCSIVFLIDINDFLV